MQRAERAIDGDGEAPSRTDLPRPPAPRDAGAEHPTPSPAGGASERQPRAARRERALPDRDSQPPLVLDYAPIDDDRADPGEIVWAWVAFEEDPAQGKDRPVLVIARESLQDQDVLIALMLTSHDRGAGTHRDQRGATWVDIGTGAWDPRGRPSEVRVDRLLRIPSDAVRREGPRLSRDRFASVAAAARQVHGWDPRHP